MDSVNSKGAIMKKERELNINRLIQDLESTGYMTIEPICGDCAGHLLSILSETFCDFTFSMEQVEDELFKLHIEINQTCAEVNRYFDESMRKLDSIIESLHKEK